MPCVTRKPFHNCLASSFQLPVVMLLLVLLFFCVCVCVWMQLQVGNTSYEEGGLI